MSREALTKLIEDSLTDPELNAQMQRANRELEAHKRELAESVLGQFDLTADEREAVISKDIFHLAALGVPNSIIQRAEWCTGD